MTWDTSTEIKLVVNGNAKVVQAGDDFTAKVKEYAKAAGLKTFRVILDGKEIDGPSDAPSNFEGATVVRIEPYDEAGN